MSRLSGKPLHFKGSTFHRIIKGFMYVDSCSEGGGGNERVLGWVDDDDSIDSITHMTGPKAGTLRPGTGRAARYEVN